MEESYCGKSCSTCSYREELGCPGCFDGPGDRHEGDCRLAACCRGRGHKTCETCTDKSVCVMIKRRNFVQRDRVKEAAAFDEFEAHNIEKCAFLGKWIRMLFLLIIPSIIGTAIGLFPFPISIVGNSILTLTWITYGVILIMLARYSDNYKIAGICSLINSVFSFIAIFLDESSSFYLLLVMLDIVPSFFSEFKEYAAHNEVLAGIDDELSEKWKKLLYLYVVSMLGLHTVHFGGLGYLIALASFAVYMPVKIVKLIYLRRTAAAFRDYDA